MPRDRIALRPPDPTQDFGGFPSHRFTPAAGWFRQHRLRRDESDRGGWFFASRDPVAEPVGRFDLLAPDGTCYLASTSGAAVRELIGPDQVRQGWVNRDLFDGRVVSHLQLPAQIQAAAVSAAGAASWRITAELTSTGDYALSQAWAQAFRDAGFGGVYGALRFGLDPGLAMFGPGGRPDPPWAGDTGPPRWAEDAAYSLDVRIVDVPVSLDDLPLL